MHFLSAALFASGATAAAVGRSADNGWDCVLANTNEMAADPPCGSSEALAACFAELDDSTPDALAECYVAAGCSSFDAVDLAGTAQRRCRELLGRDHELRRRSRGELDARGPQPTAAPELAGMNPFWQGHVFPRTAYSDSDCFDFKDKETKDCDVQTNDGKVSTGGCSTITVTESSCAAGKTCTTDEKIMKTVCMDLDNGLDVGGIIVTVIFGVAIVAGIAAITFLCCKDRKEQKRLAAKAATVELHRAATKKKKEAAARAQRAPLMAQEQERQRDVSTGSTDPFHDRNRS